MASGSFGTVRKLKSGKWQARFLHPYTKYKKDGKRNYITAPTTFSTKAAAYAWLAGVQTDIERGTWKSPEDIEREREEQERQARVKEYVFLDLARDFIDEKISTGAWGSKGTIRSQTNRINNHLKPYWDKYTIKTITDMEIDRWINKDFPRDIPRTRKESFSLLNNILNFAVKRKLIDINPCQHVEIIDPKGRLVADKKLKQTKREPKALTHQELDRLVAAMPTQYRLLTLFLGFMGLRIGEARYLKGNSVDIDANNNVWVQVNGSLSGTGKNEYVSVHGKTDNAVRTIPLPDEIAEEIVQQARAQKDLPLFPSSVNNRKAFNVDSFGDALRHNSKKIGLDKITPHDLRHTAASRLVQTGLPEPTILAIMGHGSNQILKRYTHVNDSQLVEAMRQVDNLYQMRDKVTPLKAVNNGQ